MKENELTLELWNVLKEYISKKELQTAADHVVAHLLDSGFDTDDLKELKTDDELAQALEQFEEPDEDTDEY